MILLSDDPLQVSLSKIEQLDLKLTFDVQFLIGVELNFDSPKIQQAMQFLNLNQEDLVQKKYLHFQLPEEENYHTEQRFFLHLHQVAHRRKLLVRERNKIKKEQALNYQENYQTGELLPHNHTIENAVTFWDRKLEQQQFKRDRSELVLRHKIREQIEEELKQFNESKQLQEEKLRIARLRKKSIQAVSDRAHSFNQKTDQIAKKHHQAILEQQERAIQKQREIVEREQLESEDSQSGSYQFKIKQKEKELKELLKLKEVNDRIKKIKQQEIDQCNQLYKKIEEKLNKSRVNRVSMYENIKTSMPSLNTSQKIDETQKYLEKYIQKQQRYRNNSQNSLRNSNSNKKRRNIRQSIEQEKSYNTIEDREPKFQKVQLIKNSKSRSSVNLEKIKFQQLEKANKIIEKQRSESIVQSQIKEKKQMLRDSSRTTFLKKFQLQGLQEDLSKIKQGASKDFVVRQITKWDCTDLIEKYLK